MLGLITRAWQNPGSRIRFSGGLRVHCDCKDTATGVWKTRRMAEPALADDIDSSQLVTEDDEPVDNIFSEKQQALLTDSLYAA